MPNTKTAKKQLKINIRNRKRNQHYKTRMKNVIKAFRTSIEASDDPDEVREKLYYAQKIIYITASKGVIKKGTAARKVSRLYALFNKKFPSQAPTSGTSGMSQSHEQT